MSRAKITAATTPLYLFDKTGERKEFRMSPLVDKDIAEIDEWLQARVIENACNAAANLSPEDAKEIKQIAVQESVTISFLSAQGAKILATVPGMARIAWQSLHKNHPEISVDELAMMLLNPKNVNNLNERFTRLNTGRKKRNPPKPGNSRATRTAEQE